MGQADFISLEPLAKGFINRKTNSQGQKDNWLEIKWIRVTKERPLEFQYKYSLNSLEAWKTVDLKRRPKDRPPNLATALYPGPCVINSAKKKDLLGLLSFVPPIYHSFYHRLVDQEESDSTESGDCSGED